MKRLETPEIIAAAPSVDLTAKLKGHPFFRGMPARYLEIIGTSAKFERVNPLEYLFKQGEPANCFYLIEAGEIVLEAHLPADGTVLIQTLGAGNVIGWSWLFPPFVWHLQARCVKPATLIVLPGAHILAAAERDRDFGYEIMKRVSRVAVERLQQTRDRLLQQEAASVIKT